MSLFIIIYWLSVKYREEWMAAIERVSEKLYDTGSTDVEMQSVAEENDLKGSASTHSLTNKILTSPMDPGNEEFQKFMVTGTSSRQHHSGKKKVVCYLSISAFPPLIFGIIAVFIIIFNTN